MASQPTILIVDDMEMFREIEALFLSRSGRVLTARDGAEGFEIAQRERPAVVVTDLNMPRMDGDALCKQIRNDPILRETPVVVVTSGSSGEERARAIQAGANDVLTKPLSRAQLIDAVNRFLRSPWLRGLARVSLTAEVSIRIGERDARGRARNLSRGGLFVEVDETFPIASEVELELRLPEEMAPLQSTARVIWKRERASDAVRGMGVQFLALDRSCARRIEAYLHQHAHDASGNAAAFGPTR